MLSRWKERAEPAGNPGAAPELESASKAAIFDFIDNQLGRGGGPGKTGEP
jgi:hypothetical protein